METDAHTALTRTPPRNEEFHFKRCDSCRAVGYPKDIYCPRCGTPFGPICTHCGIPVTHPVAVYCVGCGAKLLPRPR